MSPNDLLGLVYVSSGMLDLTLMVILASNSLG